MRGEGTPGSDDPVRTVAKTLKSSFFKNPGPKCVTGFFERNTKMRSLNRGESTEYSSQKQNAWGWGGTEEGPWQVPRVVSGDEGEKKGILGGKKIKRWTKGGN